MGNGRRRVSDSWSHSETLHQDRLFAGDPQKPMKCGFSDSRIAQLAHDSARKWGYIYDGKIESIVDQQNGVIKQTNFWDNPYQDNGSLMVFADGSKFTIWVSDRSNARMKLYTIAHELGHYVLHFLNSKKRDKTRHFFAARYETGEVETEADKFAINFLVPKAELKKQIKKGKKLRQISDKFSVDSHLVAQQIRKYKLR